MKTQYTPGPWRVLEPDQVRGPEGEFIADCECGPQRLQTDRANARLIALAPEMADALRVLVDTLDNIDGVHYGLGAAKEILSRLD